MIVMVLRIKGTKIKLNVLQCFNYLMYIQYIIVNEKVDKALIIKTNHNL